MRLLLFRSALATFGLCALVLEPMAARAAEGPQVQQVVIAFKTHFDIGYTSMAADVVKRYRTTMIDQALQVCDQNRDLPPEQQFVWTIPGWPMKKILEDWEGQTPQRKQRILRAYREGRFVTHALPFTTHTELLELEDLVRGMGFASQLSRAAGLPLPRDAKMTDVPCHTWAIPTLLKRAGVDFLHLGCNAGSRSPVVPMLFWWEGPDGSRVLTMYSEAGYGTGLVAPKDWPYKTWLALVHTGDNHGPPTPDEVKKLLEQARQRLPGVKVRIGRLSDFADALLAEKPDLPVVRADMPDSWIHGPLCDPAGARLARNLRPMIAAAESLQTLLGAWGVAVPDARTTIASAYEQSLLYGEHTWGGALAWVTPYDKKRRRFHYGDVWKAERAQGRFKRLEESWEEHTNYIRAARDLITPVLESDLQALAKAAGAEGKRIVVFNPLPWKRDGLVSLKAGAVPALKAIDNDQVVPVKSHGAALRFVARDLPPMGYRTYVPAPQAARPTELKADQHANLLESPFFKAVVDPASGSVRSLVDKRSGRELVDDSAPQKFGQYLYERFDADQVAEYVKAYVKISADWAVNEIGKPALPPASEAPYRAAMPKACRLRVEQSSLSVAAVMDCGAGNGLPHAVTTRVILYQDLPCVDIEVTLHDKPADPWPEAGWICLPLKTDQPQFRLGRLGSIVDPARDVVAGANRYLFAINSGLTVTDPAGRGAGLCPMDHALVSLDTPGVMKYSKDFVPKAPRVFVNLFNNHWTTNFRLWNEGTWTSRVRVWAVEGSDLAAALVTPSAEARFPLLAAMADGAAGKLPATQAGLEVARPGVLVTAFGPNPDDGELRLRLWEHAGQGGACQVRLPARLGAASTQPVDLRGQPLGASLPVQNGTFTVEMGAFAPASFLLKTQK